MYKLKWYGEVIEEDIATREEANYLRGEYAMAYGGVVTIHKQ